MSAHPTEPSIGNSPVKEAEQSGKTMSSDSVFKPEMESDPQGELADMVASMNVTANRLTPPNGYRSGAPKSTVGKRALLADRKMSLQERGSRVARQPTIETKRVSITDADVRKLRQIFFRLIFISDT